MQREQECQRLSGGFYRQSTRQVARQLLGKTLARRTVDGQVLRGIVVEVEAYLSSGDAASHSFRGPGKKNASMYLEPGKLYVYPIHSRHCMNVVTENAGLGAAVLIRALEPIEGLTHMFQQRFGQLIESDNCRTTRLELTRGPGRLCQALGVSRQQDGCDLIYGDQLWLEEAPDLTRRHAWRICRSQRIGISQATDRLLRWFIDGNQFVSGLARDHSVGRTWSFLAPDELVAERI